MSQDTKECFTCKARGKPDVKIYFESKDEEESKRTGKNIWKMSEPTPDGGRKPHEHIADERPPGARGARAGWDIKAERNVNGATTLSIQFRVYDKDKVVDELKDIVHALRAVEQMSLEKKEDPK